MSEEYFSGVHGKHRHARAASHRKWVSSAPQLIGSKRVEGGVVPSAALPEPRGSARGSQRHRQPSGPRAVSFFKFPFLNNTARALRRCEVWSDSSNTEQSVH
ncbi:hypothetical protein AGIG_G1416 [Arapaima gigas]